MSIVLQQPWFLLLSVRLCSVYSRAFEISLGYNQWFKGNNRTTLFQVQLIAVKNQFSLLKIFSDSLAIILEFLKSHPDNLDALLQAKDTRMKMTPLHTAADCISSAPTRSTCVPIILVLLLFYSIPFQISQMYPFFYILFCSEGLLLGTFQSQSKVSNSKFLDN